MPDNPISSAKHYILWEDFKKAKEILRPLAENNDAEAQLLLGYLFYCGDSDTSGVEAAYWLHKSCASGNAEAMYYVATTDFEQGTMFPGPKDSESLPLLQEAANKGSAEAQRSLAILYAHGEMVPQDDHQTMYWDEKAAKQGLAESQRDLAFMLLHGYHGAPDIPKAIYWYEKAARKDHNVPFAQWAAEELAEIYAGEPDPLYADHAKSEYWRKRSAYLEDVDIRSHPHWFYTAHRQ